MMHLDIKNLIYQRLQPIAKAAGFKILIVDSKTYGTLSGTLQRKAKSFGISNIELDNLRSGISDYGCIALLKSTRFFMPDEIASMFSRYGLEADDIRSLKTKNTSTIKPWEKPTINDDLFIYWFPISVGGIDRDYISEDIEVVPGLYGSKVKQITPISWRGISGFITANDLIDAIQNVWPGQENAIFNFGPEGEIYGQVNQVIDDGTKCILTLAPYKNGRRMKDLSLDCKDPPLTFKRLLPVLKKIDPDATVIIRMKNPIAFGPNAGKIVEQTVNKIDIDDRWGIFLRTDK